MEDHDDTREGYTEYLALSGFEIRGASGADAFRRLVESRVPDAVVMDLRLPSIDGWTLIRELKQDPRTAGVLVVVVSASVQPADVKRAQDAGCDAFLRKPCDPPRLLMELRPLLERTSTAASSV